MLDFYVDLYRPVVVAAYFRKIELLSQQFCFGCASKIKCCLLHACSADSLLDKQKRHDQIAKNEVLKKLDRLYSACVKQYSIWHTDVDKASSINSARIFLQTTHYTKINQGRFLTEKNWQNIHHILFPPKKKHMEQKPIKIKNSFQPLRQPIRVQSPYTRPSAKLSTEDIETNKHGNIKPSNTCLQPQNPLINTYSGKNHPDYHRVPHKQQAITNDSFEKQISPSISSQQYNNATRYYTHEKMEQPKNLELKLPIV